MLELSDTALGLSIIHSLFLQNIKLPEKEFFGRNCEKLTLKEGSRVSVSMGFIAIQLKSQKWILKMYCTVMRERQRQRQQTEKEIPKMV